MQPQDPDKRELTTWSEIAAYLGVTERTAQMWRKDRGLPVGKVGGRVVARTGELDRWRAGQSDPAPAPRWNVGWNAATMIAAAAVVLVAAGWVAFRGGHTRPVRYEVYGNALAVFDEKGKRAWTHDFGRPLDAQLIDGQAKGVFADVDGDGETELLFVPWTDRVSRSIMCFRANGRLAWQLPLGRAIVDGGGQTIAPQYCATDVLVLAKPRNDGGRIVVVSHHHFSWPGLVVVLTPDGKQVAEYWHPGWLMSGILGDLDADGAEEIILGGVNNSFKEHGDGASLLVLDSRFRTGQGPLVEGDLRRVDGIPPGEQAATLVFPEIPSAEADPITMIQTVRWAGEFLDVHTHGGGPGFMVHYQLDRRLRVVNITPAAPLAEFIAPKVALPKRREVAWNVLGRIKVLKNRFDHQ